MGNRNLALKKALETRNVSQEKLAKRLGISSQAVNERLNKDQDIDSLTFIDAVAELTGYTRELLITIPYTDLNGHTPDAMAKEPPVNPIGDADPEDIYRNIVEGNTEYVLIPRSVLQEKYRLVALEQMQKEKSESENKEKIIDKLLTQNEKLIAKLTNLESNHPGVKKAKQNP